MKLFKGVVAAAALTLASFSAYSAPITVGGVTWDPEFSSPFGSSDFSATARFTQWWGSVPSVDKEITNANLMSATTPGFGELMGIANIQNINGVGSGFVCSTCSLNFAFGGIKLDDNGLFDVSDSWWKVYSSPFLIDPFNAGQIEIAQSGLLFLEGHFDYFGLISGSIEAGFSEAFLSVSGGLAAWHFDTNGENDGLSDLRLSADAQFVNNSFYSLASSATITGNSIPEPASIALLGLGLLGLAGGRRFKKA